MDRILITDAEYPETLCLAKGFSDRFQVFATSPKRRSIGFYSVYVKKSIVSPSRGYFIEGVKYQRLVENKKCEIRYVKFLDKVSRHFNISYILPQIEFSIIPLSKFRRHIKNSQLLLPEQWKINTFHRKDLFIKFFQDDLKFPLSFFPTTKKELEECSHKLGFPIVLKPYVSLHSIGVRIVRNKRELINAFVAMKKRVILQEFVEGFYIFSDIISRKGKILFSSTIAIPKYNTGKIENNYKVILKGLKKVKKFNRKICRKIKWTGVFSPQYLVDSMANVYSLESNPRDTGIVWACGFGLSVSDYLYSAFFGGRIRKRFMEIIIPRERYDSSFYDYYLKKQMEDLKNFFPVLFFYGYRAKRILREILLKTLNIKIT